MEVVAPDPEKSAAPKSSPGRRPRHYATKNWDNLSTTWQKATSPKGLIMQHKKRVLAIAAIADQIRWTCLQMKLEDWPEKKTIVAMQFINSNLTQLQLICYEPIKEIRDHINKFGPEVMTMQFGLRDTSYWLMPSQKRQVEPFVVEPSKTKTTTPIPPESDQVRHNLTTMGLEATLYLEALDTPEAYMKEINRLKHEQLGHFEYELPSTQQGETWEDAIRSTMRTIDAAEMEVERHHRWIIDNKRVSDWDLQPLSILRTRRDMPTRSNQELLLEIAVQARLGSPTTQTQTTMQNWTTETEVRKSLDVQLGRFMVKGKRPRIWTNYFTHAIDHASGAEPAMFFICQHEYAKGNTKWIIGASTPLTGPDARTKWAWAETVYKAVRDQGMGKIWVEAVKKVNDRQRKEERKEAAKGPVPPLKSPEWVPIRQEVLATLQSDTAHQREVARLACKGLAIDKSMVPTQCCYRCQANFQYYVLSNHLTPTIPEYSKHLQNYDWVSQCGWDQQCAEATAACQCQNLDDENNDENNEENRPSSLNRTIKKKKKSMGAGFLFKR